MPAHIRAFIIILVLAFIVFIYLEIVARSSAAPIKFRYFRNSWLAITSIAFLSHNFWVYILLSFLYLHFTSQREPNKVALFYMLIFTVPLAGVDIPGFGVINYLFTLNHQRFLVIVLLFPLLVKLVTNRQAPERINNLDIILIVYLLLTILLHYRGTTFTDTVRFAFYQCIDVYIPYYVVSRSLRNIDELKTTIFCYIAAAMILSIIGIFEMLRHWHLYTAMERELGMARHFSYLDREGLLRAHATLARIPLGYVIAIGLGLYMYFQNKIASRPIRIFGFILLILGLISPLSRGPWTGAFVMTLTFIATGRKKLRHLLLFVLSTGSLAMLASLTPFGSKLLNLIPFIGEAEVGNITYRQRLFENSQTVIAKNPWFGSVNYLDTPEMEAMRQGQGIIDVVNTYIQIALEYGYVGLSLFLAFLILTCWKVNKYRKLASVLESQESLLGRALLSTMICIMLVIATVSSISAISIMYWTMAAMCAAYVSIVKTALKNAKTQPATLDNSGSEKLV